MGVADALDELTALDRPALARRWEAAFGVPAPKSCQAPLLRCALAWQLQSAASKRSANTVSAANAVRSLARAAASATARLPVGTRLVREWNGITHIVRVVDRGFEYDGRVWKSLTSIAGAITGSKWSGPRFFGLGR